MSYYAFSYSHRGPVAYWSERNAPVPGWGVHPSVAGPAMLAVGGFGAVVALATRTTSKYPGLTWPPYVTAADFDRVIAQFPGDLVKQQKVLNNLSMMRKPSKLTTTPSGGVARPTRAPAPGGGVPEGPLYAEQAQETAAGSKVVPAAVGVGAGAAVLGLLKILAFV